MKTILHTILITHRIHNIKMYDSIYNALDSLSEKHGVNLYPKVKTKIKEEYITNALKDEGFAEILLSKTKTDPKYKHPYMQLAIQLNPTKLLNKDIIELTGEKDLEEVEKRFNKIVEEQIYLELHTFLFWTLNRIDYAVNIPTKYVETYIKLFQRADIPYRYIIPYNSTAKGRKHKTGSYYIENKSTKINFYDKENERLNNTGEVVESAKNILRLEVQCLKGKTDAMKYKYKFDVKYLGYFLSKDLSVKTLLTYYYRSIGTGDFYKLDGAIEEIKKSKYTNGKKERLIKILEEVNSARSIWKARKKTNFEKNFDNYLREIRALGVNPVTIPREWNIGDKEKLDNINIYDYM